MKKEKHEQPSKLVDNYNPFEGGIPKSPEDRERARKLVSKMEEDHAERERKQAKKKK